MVGKQFFHSLMPESFSFVSWLISYRLLSNGGITSSLFDKSIICNINDTHESNNKDSIEPGLKKVVSGTEDIIIRRQNYFFLKWFKGNSNFARTA